MIKEVHDHGNGSFVAIYADGSEYAFYPTIEDTSPTHKELVAAYKAGSLKVIPRPPRDVEEIRNYYLHVVDMQADAQMAATAASSRSAQSAKLEESRDVMDLLHTPGGAEELAALDSVERITRWPMLMAGIGIDGQTLEECAERVHKKAMDLRLTQHAAERSRLSLKSSIRQALTADAVEAAFQAQGNVRTDVSGT
jgi:hypothetical protein